MAQMISLSKQTDFQILPPVLDATDKSMATGHIFALELD